MKIAIIGAGNVGGGLTKQWAKAGHEIFLGLRDLNAIDSKELEKFSSKISSHSVSGAINSTDTRES